VVEIEGLANRRGLQQAECLLIQAFQLAGLAPRADFPQLLLERFAQRHASAQAVDRNVHRQRRRRLKKPCPLWIGLDEERTVALPQKPRIDARKVIDIRIADDFRKRDRREQMGLAFQPRFVRYAPQLRAIVRGPLDHCGAGHLVGPRMSDACEQRVPRGGMDRVGVREGADEAELVRTDCQLREEFAELYPAGAGGDRREFTANLCRRCGLGVPGVVLRRAARQEQKDAAPRGSESGNTCTVLTVRVALGSARPGNTCRGAERRQRAEGQKFPAAPAIAEPL
jgi:hypothetical protein